MRIMGHEKGQCGQSCVVLQASWEARAQHATVSSIRHCAYTACSQSSLCQKSPGWDVVPAPVYKLHCCRPLFPSLRALCLWKRCSWQCAEVWLQTPQQQKSITCYVQKHGENPFVLGQFTSWKVQFPSKFALHQKFNFTHLFYFKMGRKRSNWCKPFLCSTLAIIKPCHIMHLVIAAPDMGFCIFLQSEMGEEPSLKD